MLIYEVGHAGFYPSTSSSSGFWDIDLSLVTKAHIPRTSTFAAGGPGHKWRGPGDSSINVMIFGHIRPSEMQFERSRGHKFALN